MSKRTELKRLAVGSLKKTFLIAIAVLFLITTGAAVGVFFFAVRAVTERYVERFAVSQNLMERNRILAIVDRDATLSLKLADDPVIQNWMIDEGNPAVREAALEQLKSYRNHFRDRSYFVGIAESLSYYVHTPETGSVSHVVLDPDAPHDRWFFETLRSDRDFWINVDFNVFLNEIRVWINSLVRTAGGELLGVAGTGMDLSDFLIALVEHDEPGIATIIVNREGQILAHRDRSIIEHNANVERNEDRIGLNTLLGSDDDRDTMRHAMDRLVDDRPDRVHTLSLEMEGEAVTAAIGFIPELQWYNLVLVDGGLIIGFGSFLPLIQVILVSLLIVIVIVVLLLNGLVLHPLEQLVNAADRVAGGDYSVTLDTGYNNEIGRLSSSFDTMTDKIRAYTSNLEQMVADRTQELQETQDRIMDSIRYGRLIQQSIMPSDRELQTYLRDWFIFHEPLDTVGGDFPFFRSLEDGFCIAAVDCTGHGVPGAFMTMLVSTVLNRVMETSHIKDGPAEMLLRTHRYVQDGLRAASDRDHLENGMDIALCRYRASLGEIAFSGAGLPLFYVQNKTVERIDGTRLRLGYPSTEREPQIPEHRVPVSPETVFFLFSDGVLDLPGGRKGFGLGMRGLTRILHTVTSVAPENRKSVFVHQLEEHRGTMTARDDMMLLAFTPGEKR